MTNYDNDNLLLVTTARLQTLSLCARVHAWGSLIHTERLWIPFFKK